MSREVDPKKNECFVMEKNEDARQDETHVPDLLEAVIRPPGLVEEELRPNLFKTTQFDPK